MKPTKYWYKTIETWIYSSFLLIIWILNFFFSSPFFIHGSELQQMKQKHVIINEFHCVVRNKKISLYFDIFRSYNEKRVGLKFHSLAEWINILSHTVLSKKKTYYFFILTQNPMSIRANISFRLFIRMYFFFLFLLCVTSMILSWKTYILTQNVTSHTQAHSSFQLGNKTKWKTQTRIENLI